MRPRGVRTRATDATHGAILAPVISGNRDGGINLASLGSVGRVVGNLIGIDCTGTVALARTGAADARIGGAGAGETNVIRFNAGGGVVVDGATRNRILRNTIGDNGGQGVDLNTDGFSPNDANDIDAGANNTQNVPVITATTGTDIRATLNSSAEQDYVIRLFSSPAGGDEGRVAHGAFELSTDGAGNAGPVTLTPDPPIPAGRSVPATATNSDTSEFSDQMAVT
jgi:hypothetical protein